MTGEEILPGSSLRSDEELNEHIRRTAQVTQHPVGTCAMGVGPTSVVDPQLRVRGVAGLRVVDASIMPTIPGGNTNAPTIMVAEKAADLILGNRPLMPDITENAHHAHDGRIATYDYIIVGAGSAGCVLANRLSANNERVLVLEAGGPDTGDLLAMPLAWFQAFNTPRLGWGFSSEPEPYADNRSIPAPRGKVVGGCSSINGMMYSRGHRPDYDEWARLGLPGWDYAGVLPYFKRSENSWRGETEFTDRAVL